MLLKGKAMNLIDIKCKCPSCGASFEIGDALEEQAVDKIRAQMRSENDQEIQEQLRQERIKAIEDGKKISIKEINKDGMWGIGTPEDLNYFLKNYEGDV